MNNESFYRENPHNSNLLRTHNTRNLLDQMAPVNPSFKHSPSQADLPGFGYTTAPLTTISPPLQQNYVLRSCHFPPSPPPTNSDPKRYIPLPNFHTTSDTQLCVRPVLDSTFVMTKASLTCEAPLSPPPTLPTSTQSLPPIDIELSPIPELADDDLCSPLSLLSLPSPPKAPSSFTHALLWPLSPEWESSTVPEGSDGSVLLDLQQSQDLDLGPPPTLPYSAGRWPTSPCSALPELDIPGLSSYPSPASSWESPASSTDMELSTPRSPFLENHLAIESDLFFEDPAELLSDFSPSACCTFSGPEELDTASSTYPSHKYPSPLHHAHLAEPEPEARLDLCDLPSPRWFDLDTIGDDDAPTTQLPPPSPSLRSLPSLSPSPPPSPSVHHINLQEAEDEEEGGHYSDGTVGSPLSPSIRFSSLPPLDTEEDELRGLDLDFLDFEEEEEDGAHSDAEPPSPSSPSLLSSSLPLVVEETQPEFAPSSPSPWQPLLALPGADVDDALIPALDWEGTIPPSPYSFSSLLTFDDAPPRSPSPEIESTFRVEVLPLTCSHQDEGPAGGCQCLGELGGLAHLRKKYTRAEREARNVEGKIKAQQATTRMVKGGYGWGVGKESEYGDKARFEARKRVKREKERGREVSELVRLGMKKRGVDADTDTDSIKDAGESEEAKKKKKKKPELKNIDQLVSKMMLRRKDNGAYRPLTGRRPFRHPSSPLVAHSTVLPEEEEGEEGEDEDEMIADVEDSPSTVQEILTPRTEGDDAAIFAADEEGSPWLTFATVDDGSLEHTRHHSHGWRDIPSIHASERDNFPREWKATLAGSCPCAAPCPPGLGFI